ncbi:hypothetical protein F4777DRAFT_133858 [Nemania sp. FL0916]|nr:hypothetical protein F4777DRAFT_133858 [Nemania sp. FL0916]
MSNDNPSSYPSLTESWTPDSTCVTSTGFWYVVYATDVVFSDMFGMPSVTNLGQKSSPTGGCVPPSYTLSVPYLTDGGCPTNYFGACSTQTSYAGKSADYIWCCPSVPGWHFNCAAAVDEGAAPYGCQATFTSGDVITGSRTDLVVHTGQAETHTIGGDSGVNAWGIALLSTPAPSTPSSTPPASTTPPPSSTTGASSTGNAAPTSSSSSSSGLSTGAAAGIGVGVGLAALAVLGVLIFFFLRRKYRKNQHQPVPQNYQPSYMDESTASQYGQSQYGQSQYGPSHYASSAVHTTPSPNMEMQQQEVRSELGNTGANRYEMQG